MRYENAWSPQHRDHIPVHDVAFSWHEKLRIHLQALAPWGLGSNAQSPLDGDMVGSLVVSRDFAYEHPPRTSSMANRQMTLRGGSTHEAMDFGELLSGPTINVLVGAEKRLWTLHRRLLQQHSSLFKQDDGEVRTLTLPEDDTRSFGLLVKWLYQGQLDDVSAITDDGAKYDYAVVCHRLHLLAYKFDMTTLANLAMDQYRQCLFETQLVPDAEEINYIYRSSPARSPFRRLMTQIAARQIMDPGSEKDAESYKKCFADHPDFAVEMVNAIREASGGMLFEDPTASNLNQCAWHNHVGVMQCYARTIANQSRPRTSSRVSQPPQQLRTSQPPQQSPSRPLENRPHSRQLSTTQDSPRPEKRAVPRRRAFSLPDSVSPASRTTARSRPSRQAGKPPSINGLNSVGNSQAMSISVNGIVRRLNNISLETEGEPQSSKAVSEGGRSIKRKPAPKLKGNSINVLN